jgi:cytoskeleton protein RodZ
LFMGSFGDKLRREREMRGITLAEMSESTKISTRHLESLEKEEFGSLPGGVFNKGFVRAYARFLGIDEDEAVADYAAVANEAPAAEDKFPLDIHEEPNRELNPKKSNFPLIFAIAALVGVLIGYTAWSRNKKLHPTIQETVSAASAVTQEPAAPASPPQQPSPADQNAQAPTPKNVAVDAPAPAKIKPEQTFSVLIKAKEDSWISVIADGKMVAQGVLSQNRHKLVRAAREITLRTGNAGGVEISHNGKPLGPIGSESETRTLMFTPAGLTQ